MYTLELVFCLILLKRGCFYIYFYNYSVTALEVTIHLPAAGDILVVFCIGLRRGCWLCHASGSRG